MSEQTFVIVGASLGRAKAAEELRACGFEGGILLVGSESERPYERPPLSKDYLRGESDRDDAFVHQQGFDEKHQVDLLRDATADARRPPRQPRDVGGRARAHVRLAVVDDGRRAKAAADPGAKLDGIH